MKKKFNIYCGLLIAAIVFGIGITMFQNGYLVVQGGIQGFEQAKHERETGKNHDPLRAYKAVRHLTTVEMMPQIGTFLEAPDSITNLKTGKKVPILTCVGLVQSKDNYRSNVNTFLSNLSLIFIIIFWISFIKLIIGVNKGRIFEQRTESLLAWGGWSVFAMYILNWTEVLVNHFTNVAEFEFSEYNMIILNMPDTALLYSAFGMLLMGQIFRIGREMKEEQELTI